MCTVNESKSEVLTYKILLNKLLSEVVIFNLIYLCIHLNNILLLFLFLLLLFVSYNIIIIGFFDAYYGLLLCCFERIDMSRCKNF